MSTHKQIDLICVAVLVCTLLVTVLFMNGQKLGLTPVFDGDAESSSDSAFFTRNDRDGDWSSDGATRITLSGDRANVSGGGAYVLDGNVVIAQSGRYALTGTLTDGSVIVSADSNAKVWILLEGADISRTDDACLRVEQADKVFLTLAPGTENSMTSGAEYSEAALNDNTGGAIFSRDDLTINGSGTLTVTAAYKHGIDVNDELVITGGKITVEAPQDAIHANDGFCLEKASLTLRAGDEGVNVQGPESRLYIASGRIGVESGGAALKCASDMRIEGGSVTLRSEADGLHSGGSVTVTDGSFNISAGDDGIHADNAVAISGGNILISECYEGIEALTIDISGGGIELYPTDDGLNANGGFSFAPGMYSRRAENLAQTQASDTWIHVSGGSITVVNVNARDADGLDANGDIVISGGTIRVSLNASGSNDAIDYGSESGGSCIVTGGELVACGSSVMAEGFSDSSTQCAVLYNLGYSAAAGSTVTVKDAAGREILSYTVPCSFSSVSLSSPDMKLGETYTVTVGDREQKITMDTVSTIVGSASGGMGGRGQRQRDNGDGSERPDAAGGRGGWGAQPGAMGENGNAMPTPPNFDGEMPDFADMPGPPDIGSMPPDMNGMRRDAMPNAAEEAAELAVEEPAPTDPQPVGAQTWVMLAACAAALLLGILIAVKYRQ